RWAVALYIDVILIENVKEIRSWGPLGADGRPIKSKKGHLYIQFIKTLEAMGYRVQDTILSAADYGDPTRRQRFVLIARRDRKPIAWPDPTHASDTERRRTLTLLKPHRTAREIIRWDIPGKSIFNRSKPLAENSLRRIFTGLKNSRACRLSYRITESARGRRPGRTPLTNRCPL
ncbi:MAG: DNA cytosine methyltransferase, partial [Blastocatellia bacterium]